MDKGKSTRMIAVFDDRGKRSTSTQHLVPPTAFTTKLGKPTKERFSQEEDILRHGTEVYGNDSNSQARKMPFESLRTYMEKMNVSRARCQKKAKETPEGT